MPQLTEAQVGVSISLPLKYSNINLIFELIETDNIMLYLSGLQKDPKEVSLIMEVDDEEELESLEKLLDLENEDEFKKKCKEFEIKETLVFNFIYICAGVYATNMSYRDRQFVFQNDEHGMTPANFIERIQKGVQIFNFLIAKFYLFQFQRFPRLGRQNHKTYFSHFYCKIFSINQINFCLLSSQMIYVFLASYRFYLI